MMRCTLTLGETDEPLAPGYINGNSRPAVHHDVMRLVMEPGTVRDEVGI